MAKKDNRKLLANVTMRRLFSELTAARQHAKEWKNYEDKVKEQIAAEAGMVDVTYMTTGGAEVGSITETDPSQSVDWAGFRAAHPELEDEIKKFLTPATTQVRMLTKWVEPNN